MSGTSLKATVEVLAQADERTLESFCQELRRGSAVCARVEELFDEKRSRWTLAFRVSEFDTRTLGFAMEQLRQVIRDVPDFPKKGIVFKDITTLLRDPKCLHEVH